VGAGIIDWSLELAATPATLLLNALAGAMPRRLWRWAPALHALGRAAGSLLGAERVSLAGRASNGQRFIAEPARVWVVRAASAAVGGRSLGSAGPLPTQAFLGDLAIPQRGLFVVGRACFESFDPRRHSAALLRSEVRAEPIPQGSGTV